MDPDPTKLLSATHEFNACRAEHLFHKALDDILTTETEAALVHLQLDKFDRIYKKLGQYLRFSWSVSKG